MANSVASSQLVGLSCGGRQALTKDGAAKTNFSRFFLTSSLCQKALMTGSPLLRYPPGGQTWFAAATICLQDAAE